MFYALLVTGDWFFSLVKVSGILTLRNGVYGNGSKVWGKCFVLLKFSAMLKSVFSIMRVCDWRSRQYQRCKSSLIVRIKNFMSSFITWCSSNILGSMRVCSAKCGYQDNSHRLYKLSKFSNRVWIAGWWNLEVYLFPYNGAHQLWNRLRDVS